MEAFRLSLAKYAMPLTGRGAAIRGGRWNSPGVELIYTASNRSLAMAEVAVHLTWTNIPNNLVMVILSLPDEISIRTLTEADLPNDWNLFPYRKETQSIGDAFVLSNEYCVLKVPSVVTRGDHNLLINPHHENFSAVKVESIEKFDFDRRLFG